MTLYRIAVKAPTNRELKAGARERAHERIMAAYPHFAHTFFSRARQEHLLMPRGGGELLLRNEDIAQGLYTVLTKAGYRVDFDHIEHHGMVTLHIKATGLGSDNYWVRNEVQDILMQGLPKTLSGYRARDLAKQGGQTICPNYATAHSLGQELTPFGYTCAVDLEKIRL